MLALPPVPPQISSEKSRIPGLLPHCLISLPGSADILGCTSQKDGVSETAPGKLFGAAALPSSAGPHSASPKGIFLQRFLDGVTRALLPAAPARWPKEREQGVSPSPPQRYLPALSAERGLSSSQSTVDEKYRVAGGS